MEVEITKMSSRGQIVIPQDIREEIHASEGTVFAVIGSSDTIILKKVYIPNPVKELKELTKIGEEFAKKRGIKNEEDVVKIIKKGRGVKY